MLEDYTNKETIYLRNKIRHQIIPLFDELKDKIFSPFFTTKARGTGLGLAVVRKAVSRHKGKLFIHSEQGKGTCFAMYFRIYKKTGDTKYG